MMRAGSGNEFLEALLEGREAVAQGGGSWLRDLRLRAVERANALSVPTVRDEEWRFTDLSALYRLPFRTAAQGGAVSRVQLEGFLLPEAATRLVFVDGRFNASLSVIDPQAGVTLANLADLPPGLEAQVEPRLSTLAPVENDAFAAVNTAFLRDGAIVDVGARTADARPIHLLFVAATAGVANYPRVLVVAGPGSRSTVIEDFVSLEETTFLTDAVSELFVGADAELAHVRLQRESKSAFHIGRTAVKVERNGRYSAWSVAMGARISRHTLSIAQAGEGTGFSVDGLALIGGRQVADLHSDIDHAHAHGVSRQLHKTVVGGGAHAVFNGKILVRPGAQQTDSGQQSRNLLLSDKARVDTKPQLEIFADDVKCAHGAAVGQIDADELFYLKSRGLSETVARNLLTYAFAAEVVGRIPVPSLVERLQQAIVEQTQSKETA